MSKRCNKQRWHNSLDSVTPWTGVTTDVRTWYKNSALTSHWMNTGIFYTLMWDTLSRKVVLQKVYLSTPKDIMVSGGGSWLLDWRSRCFRMIEQNRLNTRIMLSPFFLQEHSEPQPGNIKLLLAIPLLKLAVCNKTSVSSLAQLVVKWQTCNLIGWTNVFCRVIEGLKRACKVFWALWPKQNLWWVSLIFNV